MTRHLLPSSARRPGLALAAALLVCVSGVSAQTTPIGTGSARQQPAGASSLRGGRGTHTLDASLQVGGGLNQLEFVDAGDDLPFAPRRRAPYGSGAAAVEYGYARNRFSFETAGTSSVFHAPEFVEEPRFSHSGRIGTSFQLARRTALTGAADVIYQPVNVTSLFPDMFGSGALPIPTDYGVEVQAGHYVTYSGGVTLDQQIGRRSGLSGGAAFRHSDAAFSGLALSYMRMFARYDHELARGLSLRLGYGRGRGTYSGDVPAGRTVQTDTIDAGLGFARSLSFSRRTTLAFSTGTAAAREGDEMRWDLVGNATLAHELGRSWSVAAIYNRQMGFVDLLAEPTFSDSVSGQINGLLGRRVGLLGRVGASWGAVGFNDGNSYRAVHASAGLQTSLTRHLGMSIAYVYYQYRFDSSTFLPFDLGNRIHRQSVQASLTLGVPLLQTDRRMNAAR